MAELARSGSGNKAVRRAGTGGPRTEYLSFLLDGEAYGVQISFIAEILKPPVITEVPRAGKTILGVVSVRGKLVTIMDLRRRFRLRESPVDRKSRVLLADIGGDEQIGLLVDEVLQVHRLAEGEIEPAHVLGADQPAYIAGIARPPGTLLILLDLRPILEF